jgi:ADP-heptose:LPS heptosyltransferase
MAVPTNVKKILLPRFDTLGDMVLLHPFLGALQEVFNEARITLLVRKGYQQLAPLFPSSLQWQASDINPYLYPNDPIHVSEFLSTLGNEPWDLILFTKYEWTWLEPLIGGRLEKVRRISVSPMREIPRWGKRYFHDLKISCDSYYDELVSVDEKAHETEKYQVLINHLTGSEKALSRPKLTVPDQIKQDSESILRGLALDKKNYCACLPGGTENIAIKRWPSIRFSQIINWLNRKHKIETLLVGNEGDRKIIEEVATLSGAKGYQPSIWLGKQGEIPLLAGILEQAKFYLGNDTGPMHMSAALGIPVVALFGGGTWPRFIPKGRVDHVVVRLMPCFYCGWRCCFGDAPCIKDLPLRLVQEALEIVVTGEKSNGDESFTHEARKFPPMISKFVKNAGETFRRNEADREARLEVIHDCEWWIRELEEERQARLRQIEQIEKRLGQSETDRNAMLQTIAGLKGNLEESERGRTAGLEAMQGLQDQIQKLEEERQARLRQIEQIEKRLGQSETDRNAMLQTIAGLKGNLEESERGRTAGLEAMDDIEKQVKKLREEQAVHLRTIEELGKQLGEVEADRTAKQGAIYELTKRIEVLRAELIKSSLVWKMTGSLRKKPKN